MLVESFDMVISVMSPQPLTPTAWLCLAELEYGPWFFSVKNIQANVLFILRKNTCYVYIFSRKVMQQPSDGREFPQSVEHSQVNK